ncbi:MAG: HAMP domain-containing histidine kinase [Desulfobacterales bacterium]|nr:MAG: HAMP domain-containing histidine kinase [Desulfobacterales bacterium]
MFFKKKPNVQNTLSFRLTILYAAIFALTSFVAFSIFYYRIRSVTMELMDLELTEEIEKYAFLMAAKGLQEVRSAVAEKLESENPKEEFYRLMTFNGDVLVSTDMSPWGAVDAAIHPAQFRGDETGHVFQSIPIPGKAHKARLVSAVIGPEVILQIGETLEDAEGYLDIFLGLFLVLVCSTVLFSMLIGWFLARRATSDMEEVTRTAEEIAHGAYDRRVPIKGQFEEIKRLGTTFNTMLDRIQNLLKSMKEINDNIAHDLRSPLARIRGIAEMTLLNQKQNTDCKEMAVSTMEECDSLIDMINTMLDITEAEAGVGETKKEEFDLNPLIVRACELFRPLAAEKKIDFRINLAEPLVFQGDRKKMQRIVTNVLENAIKYNTEQGIVGVSAATDNGDVQIVVEDTGIGISESDLPQIFQRFYRCDRSRSLSGVGLGLSLAKAYTESMNGTISVQSTLNHGSTFTLRFAR